MFFWTAKILWAFFTPLTFIALMFIAGALLLPRFAGAGRFLIGAGIALFLVLGFGRVGPNLLTWLEVQYTKPTLPPGVDGVIVLSGMFDTYLSDETGQLVANDNIERLISFVDLAREHPEARLVFTGGVGHIRQPDRRESEDAKRFFEMIGFDDARVIYESRSRNTYENAIFSKDLVKPGAGEVWVLITSASHMRRAMAVFRKAGWDVIPYPVDPDTSLKYDWRLWPIDVVGNFSELDMAMREIVGYWVYGITGKSL